VGWEISVDEQTEARYNCLSVSEREEILSHIEDGVIRLCPDGKCPFLDERGLCRIISKYGEEYTSIICREHPRFYNFYSDRAEVGIGASCEVSARIILESDGYDELIPIGEIEGSSEADAELDFDAVAERIRIFSILKKDGPSYSERIEKIKSKYYLAKELFLPEGVNEKLSSLEYLKDEDRELFVSAYRKGYADLSIYSERFFAYLLYRHLGGASSFDNMRARLCLCILLVGLFEALLTNKIDKIESARLISEEIEYSEDNIDSIIFDFECDL
jgi:hypothetical protein